MFKETLDRIELSKERIEHGLLNCIPSPFPRYSEFWPGIERSKYYGVTASPKVGKTQVTDFMFLYHPLDYILTHETNIDVDVLYYSIEMSKYQKALQAISYFLYVKQGIAVSPIDLRSVRQALDKEVVIKIKELNPFMDKFFSKVKYNDYTRNRYGIWRDIFDYAQKNGEIQYEEKIFDDKKVKVISGYKPNNPDKITIIIIDHVSLLTPEKGDTLHDSIGKLSSEDLIRARNLFGFTPVIVQQQAASQESLENKKADALMPSLAGLADNKLTARDWDVGFGLFSPVRHGFNNFKGYDITKFGDRFRSMEILVNREGGGNELCPLYFRGECSYFLELPKPHSEEIKAFNP
jgi:hypothetical protein